MAKLGIYLAYDNAKSAMEYYEANFGAQIIEQLAITPEMNEFFKLDESKLADSTYSGRFAVDGAVIGCSDKVDNNQEFNDSFNIMIEYAVDELSKYEATTARIKETTEGKVIYNSEDETTPLPYKMFRYTDKFNIIWSFIIMM